MRRITGKSARSNTRLTRTAAALLGLLVATLLAWPLVPPAVHAAPPAVGPAHSITADDLESFLDEFFAVQLAQTHTPGAVIVVVQDGKTVFSKGYGLANVAQGIPMDPERTVMRLGSISKLFVATAVMQLVEQGRLDLHADVNRYLTAFQIEATYPEPITLARLLTHTSGLDEAWDTSTDPAAIPPLGAYLANHKLRRILPPGEAWYYSGVGYVEIAPLLFQSPASGKRLAFRQNERGETLYLLCPAPYRKVAWYESGAFIRGLLRAWGWLWVGVALVWPVQLLIRRWRGKPPIVRLEHLAHGLHTLLGVLNALFLVSLLKLFWVSAAATHAWLTLPLVSIGLTAAALGTAGIMWRRRIGSRAWRIYCSVVILASGWFVFILNAWNLVGFKVGGRT